ncbi:hypothetical protein HanIR_Chr04g0191061 [Helianthus annuus]|nr:hypothetical protein HanIR_Chr04g0191061 [Helianthus annuus]
MKHKLQLREPKSDSSVLWEEVRVGIYRNSRTVKIVHRTQSFDLDLTCVPMVF